MRRFCDSSSVPSAGSIDAARRAGVTAWAGYLRSPYASRPWSADELSNVLARAGALIPVFVGPYPSGRPTTASLRAAVETAHPTHLADQAVAELRAIRGAAAGVWPLVLDIEANVWAADPAGVLRFFGVFTREVARLAPHNVEVVPYSSPACLIGLGQHDHIPAVWAASWLRSTAWPAHVAPPGLGAAWAGRRAWQYHGDTRAYGLGVDLNVADDAFPVMHHHSTAPAPAPHPAPAPAPAPHPAPAHTTASATVVVDGKTFRGTLTAG